MCSCKANVILRGQQDTQTWDIGTFGKIEFNSQNTLKIKIASYFSFNRVKRGKLRHRANWDKPGANWDTQIAVIPKYEKQ